MRSLGLVSQLPSLQNGDRNGAVKKRSQLETKIEGEKQWTKQDKEAIHGRKEPDKFKGVRKEQASVAALPDCLYRRPIALSPAVRALPCAK